ncbi:hypothetical protein FACS1894198_5790 [Clostridia bacterium]|nr:hypothetical protein FACS1894198_5790 [Clostridia bacterium]
MVLSATSVSSMITPTSCAVNLVEFEQKDRSKGLDVGFSNADCEDQEKYVLKWFHENGVQKMLIRKLIEMNNIKFMDEDRFEVAAFDIVPQDKSVPHKFLLGVAPKGTPLGTITSNVCHNEIRQFASAGYGTWKALVSRTTLEWIPIIKVVFCKQTAPIAVGIDHEIVNGLFGARRDIFLQLLGQEADPEKVSTMVGMAQETFDWENLRPGYILRYKRLLRTDLNKLISSYRGYLAAFFDLSLADQKDSLKARELLKRTMDRAALVLEMLFTNSDLGASVVQNKAEIALWKKGGQSYKQLLKLRDQLEQRAIEYFESIHDHAVVNWLIGKHGELRTDRCDTERYFEDPLTGLDEDKPTIGSASQLWHARVCILGSLKALGQHLERLACRTDTRPGEYVCYELASDKEMKNYEIRDDLFSHGRHVKLIDKDEVPKYLGEFATKSGVTFSYWDCMWSGACYKELLFRDNMLLPGAAFFLDSSSLQQPTTRSCEVYFFEAFLPGPTEDSSYFESKIDF